MMEMLSIKASNNASPLLCYTRHCLHAPQYMFGNEFIIMPPNAVNSLNIKKGVVFYIKIQT